MSYDDPEQEPEMSGEETVACLLEAFEDEDTGGTGFIGQADFVRLLIQILGEQPDDPQGEQFITPYEYYASENGFEYRRVFKQLQRDLEEWNAKAARTGTNPWRASDLFNHFISRKSGKADGSDDSLAALLEEFRQAEADWEAAQRENDQLQEVADGDIKDLKAAEDEYAAAKEEAETSRYLIRQGQENVKFLESSETSEADVASGVDDAKQAVADLEKQLENEATLTAEAEKLKNALVKSGASTQKDLDELRTLRNRVERRRRDITSQMQDSTEFKEKLTRLKTQAEADKQSVRDTKRTLMESAQKLEQQNQALQARQKAFKRKQAATEARHAQVLLEASKVAADNATCQKRITELIQEAKKLREQKKRGDAMKKKFGSLRQEKMRMEEEKQRLLRGLPQSDNAAYIKARGEIESQVQTIGRERAHVAKQAHAFSQQTRKVQEATLKVGQEQGRIRQYRRDLTKTQRDIEDLREKIKRGDSKLAKMRKYDAAEAEAEQAIQTQMIDRLRAEVDGLTIKYEIEKENAESVQKDGREDLQRTRKEKRESEMKLKREIAKQEADKEIVEIEQQRTKARRRQVDDEYEKITSELGRKQQSLRDVEERANELDMALRACQEEQSQNEFEIANANIEVDTVRAEKDEIVRFRAEVEKNAEVSLDQLKEWEEERNRLIKAKQEQAEANKALATTTKTERTWFDTCRKELDKVDIEKTQFAKEKRKLETEKSRLMDLERKLRLKKVSVLTLKQEVEESGRTLAALKYDVNKESLALKQARGATNKMKSLLQQDVAEYRLYQKSQDETKAANKSLDSETAEKQKIGKDLQRARKKFDHQTAIKNEEEDEVNQLIERVRSEATRIRREEVELDEQADAYDRKKLLQKEERLELEEKKTELERKRTECNEMKDTLVHEKKEIEKMKKLWLQGLIAEEQAKLKKLQNSRDRKRRRLESMNSDIDAFKNERDLIMIEMKRIGMEAQDTLKRRKKLVSQHQSLIIVREDFNRDNLDDDSDDETQGATLTSYAVKLRIKIEQLRKDVQRLLEQLFKGKNKLEENRLSMADMRQKLLQHQNIKQEEDRRMEISKERTNLNDERRKVIESKKKLRHIIQNVVRDKQQYEKDKKWYTDIKDMREIAEMRHETDMQVHARQLEKLEEQQDLLETTKEQIDDFIYTYEREFDDLKVLKSTVRKNEKKIFQYINDLLLDRDGVVERIGVIEQGCTSCKDLLTETIKGPADPDDDPMEVKEVRQPKYNITMPPSRGDAGDFDKKVCGSYVRVWDEEGDYYKYEMTNAFGDFVMLMAVDETDEGEEESVWWISSVPAENDEEIDYYTCASNSEHPPKGPWYLENEASMKRGMGDGPFYICSKDMSHIQTGERQVYENKPENLNDMAAPEDMVCGQERNVYQERELEANQCHLDTTTGLETIGKGTAIARKDMRDIKEDLKTFEGMFADMKKERDKFEGFCDNLKEELELLNRELKALKRQKSTLLFRKTMSKQRHEKKKAKLKEERRIKREKERLDKIEEEKKELVKQKLRDLERLEKEKSSELEYLIESHLPFDKATGEVRMEIASIIADFFEGLEPMMEKLLDDILFRAAEKIEKERRKEVQLGLTMEDDPEQEAEWDMFLDNAGAEDGAGLEDMPIWDENANLEDQIDMDEVDFGSLMGMFANMRKQNKAQELELTSKIADFTPADNLMGDDEDELNALLAGLDM